MISNTTIRRSPKLLHYGGFLVLMALLGACTTSPPTAASAKPTTTAVPSPRPPPMPYKDAVLKAANDLFSQAQLPASPNRYVLVIDPLVDGLSGIQSNATQSLQTQIEQVAREKYPRFEVQPFSAASIATSPIVLVGTFTGVNQEGKPAGEREAYRICLVLADLKSGKIIARVWLFAQPEGVDLEPTPYYQDSPTWVQDPATEAYIRTCQATKVGDSIDPVYWDRIMAAAWIKEATANYNAGRYQQALALYTRALRTPGGEQLRAYNGIYLTNWKLDRRDAATQAFGQIVDYGLKNKRIAVKFLFKPGSTAFWPDPQVSKPYGMWLKQMATHTSQSDACLEITGHTSRTGPEPLNERLSLLRAEYIKQRLESEASPLNNRTIADGKGSKETLVGTGKDDVTDALDRRVEFNVIDCSPGRTG